MTEARYLLDVNVLIALTRGDHVHHQLVTKWFEVPGRNCSMCAFSEAGFLRVSSHPRVGNLTVEEAAEILASLESHSGHSFWPISDSWTSVTKHFSKRIFGHKQITGAYLLGLAIRGNGVLVTLDKAVRYLAGQQYSQHVLVLEEQN